MSATMRLPGRLPYVRCLGALGGALTVSLFLGCQFEGDVVPPGGDGGAGGSISCATPAECPDPGECAVATCTADLCGTEPAPEGTSATNQTAGDCLVNACDGAGALVSKVDSTDRPSDDACATFTCDASGKVVPDFAMSGQPCGVGLECDGQGVCAGCTTADQCPVSSNPCLAASCTTGMCAYAPAAPGMVVPGDPSNDCKRIECDASGAVVTVPDDTDLPLSDGNVCTTEACAGGIASHPPKPAGTVGGVEGTAPQCLGVCQAGAYAGTCGYRLYSRKFPAAGAWSSVALSSAWTGANAPPPTLSPGISVADITASGSRTMVFRDDGQYYELFGGTWRAPVASTTRFPNLVSGTNLSAGISGNYVDPDDLFILLTKQPQAYNYTIPESGTAPIYQGGPAAVTDDSALANSPPQHTTAMNWSFNEQRAAYGTTDDSVVTWKQVGGLVYYEYAGSAGFYYPAAPKSEAASALAITGTNGAPAGGTVVAAYYVNSTHTVFMIAP